MTSWRNVACCILMTACAAGTAGAQAFSEPKWPQQFTLERGDRMAYGIAVGAPGAIVVNVNAKGAVVVALVRPNGTVAKEMPGAGSVRVEYVATNEDVATGMGWLVGVRDAASKPMRGGRFDAAAAGAATSGTIAVEHPAGDASKVRIGSSAPPLPPAPAPLSVMLAEIRSTRERARAATQVQRARVIQGKVSPAAARGEAQPLTGRASGLATKGGAAVSTSQSASTGTGGSGAVPVGSNQPQTIAQAPVIASLDTTAGSPHDPVLITGSGFGPTPGGEVHFMVASGTDLAGKVTYWSDTQITVEVPTKDGVPAFAGQVYVRRGAVNSALVSFRFEPEMDYQTLPITLDRQVGDASFNANWSIEHRAFFGIKGDDEYFLHTTLKNGWVLDEAYVVDYATLGGRFPSLGNAKGDAYVSFASYGSDSPRIKVHYWGESINPFSNFWVSYWPVVIIRGPKGLPYQ